MNDAAVASLARSSRRSAVVTLLGAVLIFSAMMYGTLELRSLQQQLDMTRHTLDAVKQELKETRHTLDAVKQELTEKQRDLADQSEKLAQLKRKYDQARQNWMDIGAKKFEVAIPQLQEIVRDEPDDSLSRSLLGLAQVRTGDAAGAIATQREAIRRAPAYVVAYYRLSLACWKAGDIPCATGAMTDTINRDPAYIFMFGQDPDFASVLSNREFRRTLDKHKARIVRGQDALRRLGLLQGKVSRGVPGSKTLEAVQSFQRTRGMPETGLLTPDVLDELIKAAAGPSRPIPRRRPAGH